MYLYHILNESDVEPQLFPIIPLDFSCWHLAFETFMSETGPKYWKISGPHRVLAGVPFCIGSNIVNLLSAPEAVVTWTEKIQPQVNLFGIYIDLKEMIAKNLNTKL